MVIRPVALLLALLSAGCGVASQGIVARPMAMGHGVVAHAAPGAPATREAFAAAVKSKGVTLTEANLAEIQAERGVKPSGLWAARPAEHLTAEQNLDVHFRKHGHEFRPALTSAEAYMAQGNAAGTGERGEVRFFFDTTSYQKGYQTHVVRWVPKTHDFTAFRTDGAETTYYQNDPKPNRFVEVPAW